MVIYDCTIVFVGGRVTACVRSSGLALLTKLCKVVDIFYMAYIIECLPINVVNGKTELVSPKSSVTCTGFVSTQAAISLMQHCCKLGIP